MYFRSSVLNVLSVVKTFKDAVRSPNKSAQAYWGLFPFRWEADWEDCFNTLRNDGRLLVAPILQTLILNRAPEETLVWADRVADWNFSQIIPCHFDAPVKTSPQEFRQAFTFLSQSDAQSSLPEADLQTLKNIDAFLYKPGIVPPPKI